MKRILFLLVILFVYPMAYAWNAMGHQIIAQIAYDKLTPAARKMVDEYTKAFDNKSKNTNFVTASVWLDMLRAKDIHWYDAYHYIDIPFSNDGTTLFQVPEMNALSGIQHALSVLNSKKPSIKDKGMALRVLTHILGDVHQPLHTIAEVSKAHPRGDLGGNLFRLAKNPVGRNLHRYWDNGAGILVGPSKSFQIRNKARQLEAKWSCVLSNQYKKPEQWIQQSHQLAFNHAYKIKKRTVPSKQYQLKSQIIVEKQLLAAGCRLSMLLNDLAKN